MAQKVKEKVARPAAKKPAARAPRPKKQTADSGETSRVGKTPRVAKSAAPPRTRTRTTTKTTPQKAAPAVGRGSAISAEQRRAMVAEAAYFKAERRGFVGGNPEQDWREAEAEVDALLRR
jgi:hypothetical protein